MRRLVIFLIIFTAPLFAGGRKKNTKNTLIKGIVELLNSRTSKDTTNKAKKHNAKKHRKIKKKKHKR